MPSAAEFSLPYFSTAVGAGMDRYSGTEELTRGDPFIRADLTGYLAQMLASFVKPEQQSRWVPMRLRTRRTYVMDFIDQAQKAKDPKTKLNLYEIGGKWSLFIATVIPDSLNRTLMTPSYYIDTAQSAYGSVVTLQQQAGQVMQNHLILAEHTTSIADVLTDIADADVNLARTAYTSNPDFLSADLSKRRNDVFPVFEEMDQILRSMQ